MSAVIYPARPLSSEEEDVVRRGYQALKAGELRRFSIAVEGRIGSRWHPSSSVAIDARSEEEAREIAERRYGARLQPGERITVKPAGVSGYHDWFRPWGIGPAIDLVPRGRRVPGTHLWLEEHRTIQTELPL